MLLQLSSVHVNGEEARPGKTVTDKAYGRSRHIRPLHTLAELVQMQLQERATAEAEDKRNRKPRLAVECSFNQVVTKLFWYHKLLQQGRSNWKYMHMLWDMNVFFYNLYTCLQQMGNQVSGMLGVEPPSVAEYLFSIHNNLLVPLPGNINEEENLLETELNGNDTYYRVN